MPVHAEDPTPPDTAAETNDPAAPAAPAAASDLAGQEEQLAAQFKHFEEVLLRLAEITAGEDPQRAALLRRAVAKSRERLIGLQFERVVDLLRQDRLSVAINDQAELTKDLETLLDLLLSEDRAKRLESEQARLRAYLKEVNRLIKEQQGIHSQTERGGEPARLAGRQGQLAERTGKLAEQMQREAQEKPGDEADAAQEKPADQSGEPKSADKPQDQSPDGQETPSKPGEKPQDSESDQSKPGSPENSPQPQSPERESGQPGQQQPGEPQPGEAGDQQAKPAGQRVESARKRMREAQEKLDKARREEATDRQEEALTELEQAKADLEKILRQLREEELARMLALLKARFQKMLEAQTAIYEGTLGLDGVPAEDRARNDEIEAARLSRAEAQIVAEADKALVLLREEGSAAALPEAVSNMREDMRQIVSRLAEFKVEQITQGLEQDVITALEEIIAALEQAQKQHEEKPNQQQPPPPGEPQEPPLIDKLAELRIIRALQMRINRRTETYARLIEGEQAAQPDLLEALDQLAQRQERIYRTTRDIAVGKNQ